MMTTSRLVAHPLCADDLDDLMTLYGDAAVTKTLTASGEPLQRNEVSQRIEAAVAHWTLNGCGLFTFREKREPRFVGRGGWIKTRFGNSDEWGLAYAIRQDRWGQGFATEMARACIDHAPTERHGGVLSAWTLPTNTASQRVLQKVGFQFVKTITWSGLEHVYFRLSST